MLTQGQPTPKHTLAFPDMENKPTKGGWSAHRGKFARRMALGRHWKKRWQAEPEFMRASLDRMIAGNRERWKAKEERLRAFAKRLPKTLKSWEFKETLRAELIKAGMVGDPRQVHRVYVALIRKRIAVLQPDGVSWLVAS